MSKNKFEIDMINGKIMGKMISFALPLMLSGILQLLFNAVDIIVVGRFSGSQSLAAVGSTSALINMLTNLFIGISLGTNVLAARFYAAGKHKEMSETVHTSITTAFVGGVIMIFVGIMFAKPALALMDTPSDVIEKATIYMRIYFIGMPFFMLYNFGAAVLRAVGDTKRPLIFLVISGVVNACLNMFLVIVFKMDVAGVAIATVISQMISCILVIGCLYRTDAVYRLQFKKLRIKWKYLLKIFKIGVPAGLQSTLISFSNVLLQSSVNSFGSVAMAGYTAANNILSFLYMAANSISQACMSFTSQNYGACKPKRMDRVLADALILQLIVCLSLGTLAYVFGNQVSSIYTEDPNVIKASVEILALTTIPYFLCGFMDTFPGTLRGMGRSTVPMILCLLGTVGVRILWIFLFFPHNRTLRYLFISYPASWIATILMQLVYFIFIRKSVHRELNSQTAKTL